MRPATRRLRAAGYLTFRLPLTHLSTPPRVTKMTVVNAIPNSPNPQPCDIETFFEILEKLDLSRLIDAVEGPARKGAKLKDLEPTVHLYLALSYGVIEGPSHVKGLHEQLNHPENGLGALCGFADRVPDRTTISNHFQRIKQQPDLLRDVYVTIEELLQYVGTGKPASKSKKAGKQDDQGDGREPKNRDKENVDYRRRRRNEALGDRQFRPIIETKASAENYSLGAIHGDHPDCHICPKKKAQGWTCTKNHQHGVVVEMPREPGKSREWKCRCCRYKLAVIRGTLLHWSHFSCQDILIVLRYMVHSRHGISAQQVAGLLNEDGRNVSEGAVRMLMHRLRECMRECMRNEQLKRFAGETEIDEMLLRLMGGKLVSIVTLYNRPTGRVKFEIIERKGNRKPKANKREMLQLIRKHTVRESIILSDSDASILKITEAEMEGRKRGSVNHKQRQFVMWSDLDGALDKPIEVGSNRAEGVHGLLRRTLGIRNGISRHHLERYLIEAVWRINHLHNELESKSYDGEERRNLSLMCDVLAGAAGRQITEQELRGEPQKKRDRSAGKNKWRAEPSRPEDKQPHLLPFHQIVPGASQPEADRAREKPAEPKSSQMPEHPAASPAKDEPRYPTPPDENVPKIQPAQSGPPEKPEQFMAA